eukprot:403351168
MSEGNIGIDINDVDSKNQSNNNLGSQKDIVEMKKKAKQLFDQEKSLFNSWFTMKYQTELNKRKNYENQNNGRSSDTLPFNSLELFLFVQNIFLCVFSDKKNLKSKLDQFEEQFQLDDEIQDLTTEESRTSSLKTDDVQILQEAMKNDRKGLQRDKGVIYLDQNLGQDWFLRTLRCLGGIISYSFIKARRKETISRNKVVSDEQQVMQQKSTLLFLLEEVSFTPIMKVGC